MQQTQLLSTILLCRVLADDVITTAPASAVTSADTFAVVHVAATFTRATNPIAVHTTDYDIALLMLLLSTNLTLSQVAF